VSTPVKHEPRKASEKRLPPPARRSQRATRRAAAPTGSAAPTSSRLARGAVTSAALVAAAREIFGRKGFAETSLDEVVAQAGVTKGALYHHFGGKEDLFAAVYEQLSHDVSDAVVAEFLRPDPWEALLIGCDLWIDAHLDSNVQRIAMRDARAVLGWQVVRDVETRYGAVPLRGVLRRAMRTGVIDEQPLRPLALTIKGALDEACFYVADAEDTDTALAEVRAIVRRLLGGLRTPAAGQVRSEGGSDTSSHVRRSTRGNTPTGNARSRSPRKD
jgi:AcrR family transcriptional regulator